MTPTTITDKAVLVTGANRGIGQALVAEALTRGAARVYAATRQPPLTHPDGRVTPLPLDVTNPAQTKAAAFSLTQSLRALLAGRGVRVHAVLTGPTDTDMTRGFDIPKASPASVARAIFDGVEAGRRTSFPTPCRSPWRRAGAAVRPRRWSARTRRSHKRRPPKRP